jgi:hypothetical protein
MTHQGQKHSSLQVSAGDEAKSLLLSVEQRPCEYDLLSMAAPLPPAVLPSLATP